MPWKTRGNREYFYESKRINGRVEARYVGSGLLAELAAERVAGNREMRESERASRREEQRQERWWQNDRDAWIGHALALASDALHAAGYHRPDRGRWRKRRGGGMTTTTEGTESASATPLATTGASPAAPAKAHGPFDRGTDTTTLRLLLRRYCGEKDSARETLDKFERDAIGMAGGLAGPEPSPLVVMLAETVAIAWLELRLAQMHDHLKGNDERMINQADCQGRKIDRCYRRFLRASKALADVKRIDPPTLVQMNNTYNLAGPPAEEAIER